MKLTAPTLSAVAFMLWAASQLANAQITITPSSLANFTTTVGSASTTQTLSINATGPLGAIVVTAPTGFEISTNATTGFAPSITLGIPGGRVQSVYRGRFSTHTGNVWNNGSGSEFPNLDAYAAITSNGSVAAWGYFVGEGLDVVEFIYDGSNSFSPNPIRSMAENLTSNVTALYSNESAFAALKNNGSLITWGNMANGGNSTVVFSNTSNGVTTYSETINMSGSLLSNVINAFSNREAFAALKNNGSLITWGNVAYGGNSTIVVSNSINGTMTTSEIASVAGLLSSNVTNVFSSGAAFAALKTDGSVVTWGEVRNGGNSTVVLNYWVGETEITEEIASIAGLLSSNVTTIFSNDSAFAALKSDGSVVTWGDSLMGGNSTGVASQLNSNVRTIFSTDYAFAALKSDGSVITWGDNFWGGNSTSVASKLVSDVRIVYSNSGAFAALKTDGSVATWGHVGYGGNSSINNSNSVNGTQFITELESVSSMITANVTSIISNEAAFAALKSNGTVVTWGDILYGGNSTISKSVESGDTTTTIEVSSVAGLLSSNVTKLYSNNGAFAALKNDGSVVTWGDVACGGNLTRLDYLDGSLTEIESVALQLTSGVIEIYANSRSFAALKSDGSIVAWGHNSGGSGAPANIGASTSGLPAQIYVRLASTGNAQTLNGDLVFSSLTNTDDTGVEIDTLPLSGIVSSGSSGFTGSSDYSGGSGGATAPSGGSGGGSSEFKKTKKGKGKSVSAKKSGGSKKSASKKSSGSKSLDGKKSAGKKSKKK